MDTANSIPKNPSKMEITDEHVRSKEEDIIIQLNSLIKEVQDLKLKNTELSLKMEKKPMMIQKSYKKKRCHFKLRCRNKLTCSFYHTPEEIDEFEVIKEFEKL